MAVRSFAVSVPLSHHNDDLSYFPVKKKGNQDDRCNGYAHMQLSRRIWINTNNKIQTINCVSVYPERVNVLFSTVKSHTLFQMLSWMFVQRGHKLKLQCKSRRSGWFDGSAKHLSMQPMNICKLLFSIASP